MTMKKRFLAFIFLIAFVLSLGVCSNPLPAAAYASSPDGLNNYWTYYIKSDRSGKYLEIENSSPNENALVQQNDFTGADNQKWTITHMGYNEYKITSVLYPNKALTVVGNFETPGGAIGVRTYNNSSNQHFGFQNGDDGYSFILRAGAYGYSWAAVISQGSCDDGAKLIHYPYNGTSNEEFLFIPDEFIDNNLAVKYAAATCNEGTEATPYPYLDGTGSAGSDCVNFVSQCLLQKGIHEREQWFIYAKNVNNPRPTTVQQLDDSWELKTINIGGLSFSSPWISCKAFNKFWINKVDYYSDYDARLIAQNPVILFNSPYYVGDVCAIFVDGNPTHMLFVTGYVYDQVARTSSLGVSGHTRSRDNVSVGIIARAVLESYPNSNVTIRMYRYTADTNLAPSENFWEG